MTIKLTVGLACFDAFPMTWATIQALRWMHPEVMPETEILVVDNHPDSPHGQGLKGLFEQWLIGSCEWGSDLLKRTNQADLEPNIGLVTLLPMASPTGTAPPRDRVFREAKGEYVVCIDAHVQIKPGALRRLIDWYDAHPGTRDLLTGPLLWDDLRRGPTHMRDQMRGGMWGTWDGDASKLSDDAEPFEIPAMGLGLFSCRKDAWLGFNPKFRQFGGEEWYIHEKYRKAGARCLCLPFMQWNHFFWPDRTYQNTTYGKVRNMVLGHTEIGKPLDRVHRHWVMGLNEQMEPGDPPEHGDRVSEAQWAALTKDPSNPPEVDPTVPTQKAGCCGGNGKPAEAITSLEQLYQRAALQPSDINEHAPKLRELASQCESVAEFGMRHGVSTVALLAGQPQRFTTYDLRADPIVGVLQQWRGKTDFKFTQGDSLHVDLEPVDLLFIDTVHHAPQLSAELVRHGPKVRRWIAMHDTAIYGENGEGGQPGLLVALRAFLRGNPEWTVIYQTEANNGLTVISRSQEDKPQLPGIVKMAWNYAKARAAHALGGGKILPEAHAEARLDVCSTCPQRVMTRCTACGCFLDEIPEGITGVAPGPGRAFWAVMPCPIGRWSEVDQRFALPIVEAK